MAIVFDFSSSPYDKPPAGSELVLYFGGQADSKTVQHTVLNLGLNLTESQLETLKEVQSETLTLAKTLAECIISPSWVVESDPLDVNRSINTDPIEILKNIESDPLTSNLTIDDVVVDIMEVIQSEVLALALTTPDMEIEGGQTQNLPSGISTGGKIFPWGDTQDKLDQERSFPFEEASGVDNHLSKIWEKPNEVDLHLSSSYVMTLIYQDLQEYIPWGDFADLIDMAWYNQYVSKMEYVDWRKIFPFAIFQDLYNIEKKIPYLVPDVKDKHRKFEWEGNETITADISHQYDGTAELADLGHITYWGPKWYSLICQRKYFPPKGKIVFQFNNDDPNAVIPDVTQDPLNFEEIYDTRCPYDHWHSGRRDRYEPEIIVTPLPELREFYYMLNTISLKRLPDNAILDAYTVDIQTDIDSWTWDFSITLTDESYLNLVKPSLASNELVLIDIEVKINSWVWTCRVESWSESVTFGQRSWTIRGRSPSIQLAAPYALPGVITNSSDVQGSNLIDDILSGTGWAIEWGHANNITTFSDYINPSTAWLIPAGVFNVSDKTRMQAVQEVVKAIDARIITTPDCYSNKKLIVVPRYRVTPWGWDSETADHEFNSVVCWELSRQYESMPKINAVVVSGQNQGVVVNATRNGTAGDKAATMVTDALITSEAAGSERAKNVLSKEGMWTDHTIKLFSLDDLVSPTGDFPGLILPGKILAVTEGTQTWKGQSTSVTIHGESMGDRKGIEVTQTIGVEEYHG